MVKSRSGDGQECSEIYNGKWSFYHIMLFLKDTTMPRETESNISDTENAQENEDDHFSGTDETDVNKNRDYSHSTSYANVIEPSLSEQIPDVTLEKVIDSSEINPKKRPKKKEKTTSFEDQLLKIEHEKNQKISALLEKQMTNSDDDEDMHFFKSLLPYFKKMNALQKLRVRNIFQETILSELSSQTNQNLMNKTYDYNTANIGHSYATSSYASPNPTLIHYSSHPGTSVQIQHQNICSLDEDTNFSV